MEVKGLFSKDQTIGKINEVQLCLISTSTSEVVSLVSLVDTKQVRKAVISYRFCSHENLINTEINTEEEAHESVLNLIY